jgi:hypothetical protein
MALLDRLSKNLKEEHQVILNNTKLHNDPDGTTRLTTSLMVNAASLPLLNVASITAKAILPPVAKVNTVPPGPVEPIKPGTEVEIFVEVVIPRKAVQAAPTPPVQPLNRPQVQQSAPKPGFVSPQPVVRPATTPVVQQPSLAGPVVNQQPAPKPVAPFLPPSQHPLSK